MSANCRIRLHLRGNVLVILVYMRGIDFLDAAGLGVLVGGYRRLRDAGVAMTLVSPRRSAMRALTLVGLDSLVIGSIIQGDAEPTGDQYRPPLRQRLAHEPGQAA